MLRWLILQSAPGSKKPKTRSSCFRLFPQISWLQMCLHSSSQHKTQTPFNIPSLMTNLLAGKLFPKSLQLTKKKSACINMFKRMLGGMRKRAGMKPSRARESSHRSTERRWLLCQKGGKQTGNKSMFKRKMMTSKLLVQMKFRRSLRKFRKFSRKIKKLLWRL